MSRARAECEACLREARTESCLVHPEHPNTARNLVRLCRLCAAKLRAGDIRRDVLQAIANEREDALFRTIMGHRAYVRDSHGAIRQIR